MELPMWTLLIFTMLVLTEGQILANNSLNACTIKPATDHDAKLIETSVRDENMMIWITINNIDTIINLNGTSDMQNWKSWVLTLDDLHKQLLLLSADFIPMSLGTLSFGVVQISINISSSPNDCLLELNITDQEKAIYRQMIDKIFHSSVDLPDTSEVCHKPYALTDSNTDTHYQCYDGFKWYLLVKGFAMRSLDVIYIISMVIISNWLVYVFFKGRNSLKFPTKCILFNANNQTARPITSYVKMCSLTDMSSYPSTLFSFVKMNLTCIFFITRATSATMSKRHCKYLLRLYCILFLLLILLGAPFFISLLVRTKYEIADAEGEAYMFNSLLAMAICLAFLLVYTIISLKRKHEFAEFPYFFEPIKNNLKRLHIYTHTLHAMYSNCRKNLDLKYKLDSGITYFLILLFCMLLTLIFSMPSVNVICLLFTDIILIRYHEDRFDVLFDDLASIVLLVGLYVIPSSYTIYFCIRCIAYVTLGVLINYDDAKQWAIMLVLINVYCIRCFHKVSVRTFKYSQLIHKHLQQRLDSQIQKLLDDNCVSFDNDSIYGLIWWNHLVTCDDNDEFDLAENEEGLVYYVNTTNGTFSLPTSFILEALNINDDVSPGPLEWQYLKAFIESLSCAMIIWFVVTTVFLLGKSVDLPAFRQTGLALSGGVLPFLLEKLYSKSSGYKKRDKDGLIIWKRKLENYITKTYSQDTSDDL